MDIINILFGPLDKSWCNIFVVIATFILLAFILGLFLIIFILVKKENKFILSNKIKLIWYTVLCLLSYIIYRILYQICIKTL